MKKEKLLHRPKHVNRIEKILENFSLLRNLGMIIVPDEYRHKRQLERFFKKDRPLGYKLGGPHFDFLDNRLPKPARILKPGDQLNVDVFRIRSLPYPRLTWQDCLDFLRFQKAVFPGAQGASLVFDQKFNELPRLYRYYTLDPEERLPRNFFNGHVGMPCMTPPNQCISCSFFELRDLHGHHWAVDDCLLCFSEVA